MPLASVGDIELDYERRGSGPPLLLIMGMSGTALHWGEPFLSALERDFEVISYDHRGVGASSRLEGPVTIVQMAEDAGGLLDALGIDSAHILGISMGGMIAQELALAHPERVRTLTLGCTYCGGEGSTLMSPDLVRRLSEVRRSRDRERILKATWEANVSATQAEDAGAYATYRTISQERAVALRVIAAQVAAIDEHDTSARLHELAMPTLVVHGAADQVIPVENGRMVASLIAGSRLEILDGVGHLFFWERPDHSAALVREHAGSPLVSL
jgi:3-oxoadipate enol-lactonase